MKISAILLTVFSVVIFVFTNANSSNLRGKPNVKDEVLDCNDYDPKLIKLVTFDVFAALMDLNSSLLRNVGRVLPTLTSVQVNTLVQKWESAYSDYAGTVFDENVTGSQPFQWVISTSLKSILQDMNISVTNDEFNALLAAWSDLIPWPGTTETLQKVSQANFKVATLSNGDENTLKTAMKYFDSYNISFSYYFNSNFPNAGSFKPDENMYHQLLKSTNYSPQEILHVAGANIDGWGSRNAGLYSALVNSPPYPKKPLPCFFLKNITEVPGILGIQSSK